jgi:hypothetical protein
MSDRRRKAGRRGDKAARQARVRQIADVLKTYDVNASPFRFEAACRHGLRAQLCLNGWDYHEADAEAHKLVQAALDLIGARRPPWWEGQPDHALKEYSFTERTRCVRCGRHIPEENHKYCSRLCARSFQVEISKHRRRQDFEAGHKVRLAAWTN